MSFLDGLFNSRELYLLTGADGRQVHLGFVEGRKAVFFFTTRERAMGYIQANRIKGSLSRVNWKAFDQVRADLAGAHVRQAAIDPLPGAETEALVLPIDQVRLENDLIWAQAAR